MRVVVTGPSGNLLCSMVEVNSYANQSEQVNAFTLFCLVVSPSHGTETFMYIAEHKSKKIIGCAEYWQLKNHLTVYLAVYNISLALSNIISLCLKRFSTIDGSLFRRILSEICVPALAKYYDLIPSFRYTRNQQMKLVITHLSMGRRYKNKNTERYISKASKSFTKPRYRRINQRFCISCWAFFSFSPQK